MLKDVTLGQFFPGSSIVHRLDPRCKLLMTIVYIAALFTAESYVSYAAMLIITGVCIALSRIPLKVILRGLKPLWVIIALTAVLNMFFTPGRELVSLLEDHHHLRGPDPRRVHGPAHHDAHCRHVPADLYHIAHRAHRRDGDPLRTAQKAQSARARDEHDDVHGPALHPPTLIEETDKIMSAQKARGADFETGNLFQRAKALLPLLVPLFVSAFRRADELAVAMECRCYHGDQGRTRMKQLKWRMRDTLALLWGALVLAGVIVLARFGL